MRCSILLLSFAGLVWGCGGSSAGPGGGVGGSNGGDGSAAAGVSADSACGAVVKARCTRRDSCTNGLGNKLHYGDEAICESRERTACVTGLSAAGSSSTPTSVEACAAALPTESCTDYLDGNPTSACVPLPGTRATGASCLYDAQCESTHCAVPKGAACGTCAAAPKAGDSCASTGSCGRDLTCVKDTQVCVVLAGSGAPCGKDNPCKHGLSCVGATKTAKGKCEVAAAAVDAPCDPKQAAGPGCDGDLGLFCNPSTMKCAAATFASPGQACDVIPGGFALCTAGASCQKATGAKTGTCVSAAADGATCDPMNGPFCLPPERCVVPSTGPSGTCKMPDPAACK